MKSVLCSNLILSIEYGSIRSKTHVPQVLEPQLSSYAVQSKKWDGAPRISTKITIASWKEQIAASLGWVWDTSRDFFFVIFWM